MKKLLTTAAVLAALTAQASATEWYAAGQNYDSLARNPTAYSGKIVSFRGKVIQSVQTGQDYVLRVSVTMGEYNIWKDTVYVEYRASSSSTSRIVEDDIIDFRGRFVGIKSYTAVLGQTIQIPHIIACEVHPQTSIRVLRAPQPCD